MDKNKLLPKDEWHRKYYWDLMKNLWVCSRCSNCKFIDSWEVKNTKFAKVCPSSLKYGFDAYSCQGRMDISLALMDGRLKYEESPELLDIFYKCNMCGGCDASCKRGMDMEPLRVLIEMRAKLVEEGCIINRHKPLMNYLRKEKNMMMREKVDRGKWAEGLEIKDLRFEKAEIAYHAGCHISYNKEQWHIARTSVNLLKKSGMNIGILGSSEMCCGCRAFDMGYRTDFAKLAEENMTKWAKAEVKTVITSCADCYYALKRLYSDLGVKFEVFHTLEILHNLLMAGKLKFTTHSPLRVTYHDPCHIGRRLNVYEPGKAIMGLYDLPREILKAIPGISLVEMYRIKEYAWCCGAGGGVKEGYPKFSNWTANERIKEAMATEAEAMVTCCPWCEQNFKSATKGTGGKMKIYDIAEFVYKAIGN